MTLPTGKVIGRFIVEVQDDDDIDQDPQLIPATGTIMIRPSVDYLTINDPVVGPFTTFRGPHIAILDSEGYISTASPTTQEPMYRGAVLWANDSKDMSVNGWTYTAHFDLKTQTGKSLDLPSTTFELATGQILDLANAIKVPATPGYGLPQAEAAAIRAEAIAKSILEDAESGLFDGKPGMSIIRHGDNPNIERPDSVWVLWIGGARPENILDYDLWDNS